MQVKTTSLDWSNIFPPLQPCGQSEPQKQTVIKAVLESPEGSQEISISMFFETEKGEER